MTLVRLKPEAPQSRVKHSTTEPLRSLLRPVKDNAKEILHNVMGVFVFFCFFFILFIVIKLVIWTKYKLTVYTLYTAV